MNAVTSGKEIAPAVSADYKVVEMESYAPSHGEWTGAQTQLIRNELLPSRRIPGHISVTILDFDNTRWSKDTLFPFLVEMARRQHDGIVVILVNTENNQQIFDISSDRLEAKIRAASSKLKSLLVISKSRAQFLGLSPEENRVADDLVNNIHGVEVSSLSKNVWFFADRNEHLIQKSAPNAFPTLKIKLSDTRGALCKHYVDTINRLIEDNSKLIFYTGKFLLPSNVYVESYFRINRLLTYGDYQKRIVRAFLYKIMENAADRPDVILTISSDMEGIGSLLVNELRTATGHEVNHIHIPDARAENDNARVFTTFLRNQKVIVVASVIGTGKSLEAILKLSSIESFRVSVLSILCLIDGRSASDNKTETNYSDQLTYEAFGQTYPFFSIRRHPLRFYSNRPNNWRVEDIVRINPETNAPEPDLAEPSVEPMWTHIDDFFLNNVVRNSQALKLGHFERNDRHYIYYFDILKIAMTTGSKIGERIHKDIDDYCRRDEGDKGSAISLVVYDEKSRGAKTLAKSVAAKFPGSQPTSTKLFQSQSPRFDEVKNSDVVIIENAVASGSHLQSLIDLISTGEPRRMFVYMVLQRRETDAVRFLQRIDKYRGIDIRIRCFAELEIPQFTVLDCPVCVRIRETNELVEFSSGISLDSLLALESEETELRSIGLDEEIPDFYQDHEKVIRQTILRRQIGHAKTNLQSRYPLNEILKNVIEDRSAAIDLVSVISRELSVLTKYKEVFFSGFVQKLESACVYLLSQRLSSNEVSGCLRVLSRLSPDGLLNHLVPIFKSISIRPENIQTLFVEMLRAMRSGLISIERFAVPLDLCQQALEKDPSFRRLPVKHVAQIGSIFRHLRSLSTGRLSDDLTHGAESWRAVGKMWEWFGEQEGRVHPKLIQDFPNIIGIFSVDGFRRAYGEYYDGPGNFRESMHQVIGVLDLFAKSLRTRVKDRLSYFLAQGEASFRFDFRKLDESLTLLAILDSQGRLTEDLFNLHFYQEPTVNNAIQRLRQHVFDENASLSLRQVLIGKFTSLQPAVEKTISTFEPQLDEAKIKIMLDVHRATAFIPEEVFSDIVDGLMRNILKHAFPHEFSRDRGEKLVRILVRQHTGEIRLEVFDSGKGFDIEAKHGDDDHVGGIRRTQLLLDLFGGSIEVAEPGKEEADQGFTTVVRISLLSKEKVLWPTN